MQYKKEKDENGSVLMFSIILMVVFSIILTALASTMYTTMSATTSRNNLTLMQMNSDAGFIHSDSILQSIKNTNFCNSLTKTEYSSTSSDSAEKIYYKLNFNYLPAGSDCSTAQQLQIVSTGYENASYSGNGYAQERLYSYTPGKYADFSTPRADSAIHSSGVGLQTPGINIDIIYDDDMDTASGVVVENGNYECPANADIDGDIVVVHGDININSNCHINGNIYVYGTVKDISSGGVVNGNIYAYNLDNNTTPFTISNSNVRITGSVNTNSILDLKNGTIDGDVVSTYKTDTSRINSLYGVTINGNLITANSVNLNNVKIGGNVLSAGYSGNVLYAATVHGNLRVNGYFKQFQSSVIYGDTFTNSSGGSVNSIAPNVIIGGSLKISKAGRSISTWGSGPQVANGIFANVEYQWVSAPSAFVNDYMATDSTTYPWADYTKVSATSPFKGYNVYVVPTNQCSVETGSDLFKKIESFTSNTIVDARSCGTAFNWSVSDNISPKARIFVITKSSNIPSVDFYANSYLVSFIHPNSKYTWSDYSFSEDLYKKNNWNVWKLDPATECNFQISWSGGPEVKAVAKLEGLKTKTVIDARSCTGTLNFYGANIHLQTDVAFIINGSMSLNASNWSSADGATHSFDIIYPDNVKDGMPTCNGGSIDSWNANISDKIEGFIYTPCSIGFGSSSKNIVWRGSLYTGGNLGISNGTLIFKNVKYPEGFDVPSSSSGSGNNSNDSANSSQIKIVHERSINNNTK